MNSMYILDIFILIAAAYLLYVAFVMKFRQVIPKSIMQEEMSKKCIDKSGFINMMFPWFIGFGIVSMIAGAAGIAMDYLKLPSWTTYITSGIFLIFFFIFIYIYRKAISKYFGKI